MPISKFTCRLCGARAPKKYLKHSQFPQRMAWLRRHRKAKHPKAHKKSIRKAVRTRLARA